MWRTVKLGEICKIVNGSTPSRKEKTFWEDGDISWFTIDDMREQGRDIFTTAQHVTQRAVEDKKVKLVPENSVLLCCTASIGETAIARKEMATNQQFNSLTPLTSDLSCEYLYYVATTLKDKLLRVSGSTTISFVSMGKLKEIEIPLPPLAEQQRIVAKLDAAFAEIDRAVELTNENLHLAEQSTESFLTDIIINADKICHKRLGDACEFSQGVQVPKPEQSETLSDAHPQRFLRIIDFTSEGMEPPRYISQKGEKYHMTENDVALVRYGNPGFVCRGLEGTLANNLFKVIPRTDELDNSYLYYFLKSGLFQRAIRLKAHGVAMQAISFSLISDIELLLPPTELQKKIVKKAEAIEATLLQLEGYYSEKLHLLERLKSSLLAQELRTPQSEAA